MFLMRSLRQKNQDLNVLYASLLKQGFTYEDLASLNRQYKDLMTHLMDVYEPEHLLKALALYPSFDYALQYEDMVIEAGNNYITLDRLVQAWRDGDMDGAYETWLAGVPVYDIFA